MVSAVAPKSRNGRARIGGVRIKSDSVARPGFSADQAKETRPNESIAAELALAAIDLGDQIDKLPPLVKSHTSGQARFGGRR